MFTRLHIFGRSLCLAVLSMLAASAAPTQAAEKGGMVVQFSQDKPVTVTVSGVVRDKKSGQGIANASVRAHLVLWRNQGPELFDKCPYQEVTADEAGKYEIRFVTPLTTSGAMRGQDRICVYAGAPGYETKPEYARSEVTVRNLAFTNFNFDLGPGKKLRGVVLDSAGQPVPNAYVRVQNGSNGDWNFFGSMGKTFTKPDGTFELWIGTADTEYLTQNPWLCIIKEGVGTLFAWDLLAKEDLGALKLNAGGDIIGKVVDANGAPLANCEVSVRRWPFGQVATELTDQEGKYHLRAIPGEPSIAEFYKKKNGRYDTNWGKVDVHARVKPSMDLKHVPHCEVVPKDGQIVTSPDLSAGGGTEVAGVLVNSRTALGLGGLQVRLDGKWEDMVEVDVNGRFRFPFVPPGKHTLTAYLPHNLRYDRGIGKTQIEVKPGNPLKDIRIQLEDLAELRVQYLDAKGNPLSGISGSATWSKSGDGGWTEGTVSDEEGWAVIYLYPEGPQYIRGFDRTQKLVAETAREVKPEVGQVLPPVQVVMVPCANVTGRLVDAQGAPIAKKMVLTTIKYADGTDFHRPFQTDADGAFKLESITPGILKLSFEIEKVLFDKAMDKATEVQPGASQQLGNLVLKGGVNKAGESQTKVARAMQNPQEVSQAAEELFNKIRGARYDDFLKPRADWRRFPIVGYYQTHHWFDVLVEWMSTTFKTNPIVNVELGKVYANPREINGQKSLPTVPYKVTLKNGTVLQGDLPFEYNYDNGKGHWHGIEGIDWHLQKQASGSSTSAKR